MATPAVLSGYTTFTFTVILEGNKAYMECVYVALSCCMSSQDSTTATTTTEFTSGIEVFPEFPHRQYLSTVQLVSQVIDIEV